MIGDMFQKIAKPCKKMVVWITNAFMKKAWCESKLTKQVIKSND